MKRRRVIISGASGLVGSALSTYLLNAGYDVVRLVRRAALDADEVRWSPGSGQIDAAIVSGSYAVVNLSGHNIASLWTKRTKELIRVSRISATRTLSEAISAAPEPPQVYISASAVGYYGDRGEARCTEETSCGEGFLAQVCRAWEATAAVDGPTRVVNFRTGLVLSLQGGLLAKMLPAFRCCLGGPLGDGSQYMSWIDLHDLVRAIHFVLDAEAISGPINAAAPNPVTNEEFTRTLSRILDRPAVFRVPEFLLRALPGNMGAEVFLAGVRAIPEKLLKSEFKFEHNVLDDCLRDLLKSS
ncbi:MAG: TIGR01777 family oxidoreductase [Bdellovibrionales bacterium]|nr:TIGR01777 family oxidoreductase [Bdellovibrionales bacterium]